MPTNIFVNLPVKDLKKTMNFFSALGYKFNPQFTDEKAACMIIGENIYAMLLREEFFKGFTKKEISDTSKGNEVILALSADSREAVDEIVDKAVAAGAPSPIDSADHGFMYSRSFADPDGHMWEVLWMDPNAVQQTEPVSAEQLA